MNHLRPPSGLSRIFGETGATRLTRSTKLTAPESGEPPSDGPGRCRSPKARKSQDVLARVRGGDRLGAVVTVAATACHSDSREQTDRGGDAAGQGPALPSRRIAPSDDGPRPAPGALALTAIICSDQRSAYGPRPVLSGRAALIADRTSWANPSRAQVRASVRTRRPHAGTDDPQGFHVLIGDLIDGRDAERPCDTVPPQP